MISVSYVSNGIAMTNLSDMSTMIARYSMIDGITMSEMRNLSKT